MQSEDEATQQAYDQGRTDGFSMGGDIVLRVLLQHVIATSDDPAALSRQLLVAANSFAGGINDGTGVDGPMIAGVRAGAIERIAGFFAPARPATRQ